MLKPSQLFSLQLISNVSDSLSPNFTQTFNPLNCSKLIYEELEAGVTKKNVSPLTGMERDLPATPPQETPGSFSLTDSFSTLGSYFLL